MSRKLLFLPFGFLALIALAIGWAFYRNSRIDAGFGGTAVGASDTEVVRLLGGPSWIEPCGKSFGTPKPNCSEYIYRNSFAPLIPEYYSVRFDNNGHVIDKYVYSSS